MRRNYLSKKLVDEKDRDYALIRKAEKNLMKPLGVLDNYLADKNFLVANKFTIVDINMANILAYARRDEYDFSPYKKVAHYLQSILS